MKYCLIVASLLILATACHGIEPPVGFPGEFSVQWRGRAVNERGPDQTTRIRVQNRMIRMEGREGSVPHIVLYDNNERVMYSWHPGDTSARREPLEEPMPLILFPDQFDWQFIEVALLDGKALRKYKCVPRDDPDDVLIVWVDAERRLIVRSEDDGYIIDWINYRVGEQDRLLFRPPEQGR